MKSLLFSLCLFLFIQSPLLAADISMSNFIEMHIKLSKEEIKYLQKRIKFLQEFQGTAAEFKVKSGELARQEEKNRDEIYDIYGMTLEKAKAFQAENQDFINAYFITNKDARELYLAVKITVENISKQFQEGLADKGLDLEEKDDARMASSDMMLK